MKRVITDLGFLIVAAAVAFLIAGRPPQELQQATEAGQASVQASVQASGQSSGQALVQASGQAAGQAAPKSELSGQAEKAQDGAEAGKRNIFTTTGRYEETGPTSAAVMPENPYELIGIVGEGGTKALFREYTGNVVRAGKGHTMLDGFVVKTVEAQRVITSRGEERKEFCLFGASGPTGAGKGMPHKSSDQPPVLIGILGGEVRKAVFRDQAGALTLLEVRRSLPDGSVITRIDPQSVTVRKGGKSEELKPRLTGHPAPPVLKIQEVASGQTAGTTAAEKYAQPSTRRPRPADRGPRPASRIEDRPVHAAPGGI